MKPSSSRGKHNNNNNSSRTNNNNNMSAELPPSLFYRQLSESFLETETAAPTPTTTTTATATTTSLVDGLVVDDDFLEQQAAILRDFQRGAVAKRSGNASSSSSSKEKPACTTVVPCHLQQQQQQKEAATTTNTNTTRFEDADFFEQQAAMLREFQSKKSSRGSSGGSLANKEEKKLPCHLQTTTSRTSSHEEDADVTALLEDAELRREQERILRSLQKQQQTATDDADSDSSCYDPSSRCSRNSANQKGIPQTITIPEAITITKQKQMSPRSSSPRTKSQAYDTSRNSRSGAFAYSSADDVITHLDNGQRLRIRGTQHAYEAIARGQAIVVDCSFCGALSQVSGKSKHLYCTICGQVSPTLRFMPSKTLLANGNTAEKPNQLYYDGRIAKSLQHVENDIASARERAKVLLMERSSTSSARPPVAPYYSYADEESD